MFRVTVTPCDEAEGAPASPAAAPASAPAPAPSVLGGAEGPRPGGARKGQRGISMDDQGEAAGQPLHRFRSTLVDRRGHLLPPARLCFLNSIMPTPEQQDMARPGGSGGDGLPRQTGWEQVMDAALGRAAAVAAAAAAASTRSSLSAGSGPAPRQRASPPSLGAPRPQAE